MSEHSKELSGRLGFGCAPMLGRVGRKESLRALAIAYDNGIRHFDVARSYGFGEAEALLGEFLAGKRQHVTVTSKFGVVPPRNTRALSLAKSLARGWIKRMPGGRRMVHAASRVALSQRNYEVGYARACLEQSLRQLRSERIDYYLIHEPHSPEVLSDELHRFLDDAQREGKIGQWGVTIDSPEIMATPLAQQAPAWLFEANLNVLDRLHAGMGAGRQRFLSRPYGGGPDSLAAGPASRPVRDAVSELGLADLTEQELAMHFALSLAGEHGIVVTSMFSEQHIRQNMALLERYRALGERGRALAPTILGGGSPRPCRNGPCNDMPEHEPA